jgi:hypothetical protein
VNSNKKLLPLFQEDVIDDLTSQVQMLEQMKLNLELSITAMKKDHRVECAQKVKKMQKMQKCRKCCHSQ